MADTDCFAAPWSRLLGIMSGALVLLVAGITLSVYLSTAGEPTAARLAGVLLPWAMLLSCAAFMVRGYRLENGTLVIERPGWTTRIPLAGLRSAEADPAALDGSIRLFANGGGFVFAGLMRSKRLGRYRAWVNDPARSVILRFDHRVVVVSPAEPQRFVAAVMAQAR